MKLLTSTGSLEDAKADALLIGLFEGKWDKRYDGLDKRLGGALKKALDKKRFTGEFLSSFALTPLGKIPSDEVSVVGLGKSVDLDAERLKKAVALGVRGLQSHKHKQLATDLHRVPLEDRTLQEMAQIIGEAAALGSYRFVHKKEQEQDTLAKLTLIDADNKAGSLLKEGLGVAERLCEAVNYARDLVNRPPSDKHSVWMAQQAQALAKRHKLKATVFDKPKLKKMGCNGILAVNRGSAHDARMVVLEYKNGKGKPTVLVGKGITFDAGGLGIKPAKAMEDMKIDMGGAAAVLGTLKAAALLKLPVHLIGVIGLTDNVLGPDAYKPGDIITAYNGKTIEVLHTDAEGRIVLADCLSYVDKHLKPARVIDLATLTGACVVALGNSAIGLMGNDDELIQALATAGQRSTDKAWPLPLYDDYKDMVKSEIADVKNIGARGKAGACSAGAFLSNFVGDHPWAHLDIAGPAYLDEDKNYLCKGATGAGVRLLTQWLRDR